MRRLIQFGMAALALSLITACASIQHSAALKHQIIGTWNFTVAEVKAPDGKISYPFGEKPKGILVFTPDGHFTQIHVAGDVPKIASNNRLTGTPEEYGAIMRRSLSVFGTYTVDVNKEADFYLRTWELLAAADYAQYEVSNFARPGHECRHNLNTWNMHEWVGLGPSAASQFGGWRSSNPPNLDLWLTETAAGRRAMTDRVELTNDLLAADSVIFGLRMNEGVSVPKLQRRFPTPRWKQALNFFPKLLFEGLAVASPEGQLSLTPRGRLLADAVGAEILEAFAAPANVAAT